ncbi:MAG: hypothetical protein EAZ95_20255, partial [Bacteroidetes bacterium]
MKDKHIQISEDELLLREIKEQVQARLQFNASLLPAFLVFKFLFYFSLQLACYLLLFQLQNAGLFILCFVSYGILSILFAFNFAHDFSHNTIFASRWWNNAGFTFIYTLTGAHAEAWKYRHVHSHHFAPNVKDYDSDLKITSLIRVEPNAKRYWFHKFQHFYAPLAYTTYSLFWVFIKDFAIYLFDKEYPKKKTLVYHVSFWGQKIAYFGYILVLPLLFSYQSWQIVLLAFLLMHLLQSLFLLFTFFMTHHIEGLFYPETDEAGYIQTSWVRNQILSSNDFYPFSPFANFIFGGFNNHIAHHIFPHIHHVHYPRLNKILYEVLQKNNIQPKYTTYWGGIVSHLRHLWQL